VAREAGVSEAVLDEALDLRKMALGGADADRRDAGQGPATRRRSASRSARPRRDRAPSSEPASTA
jgi:hypothetical protein